MIKVKSVTKSYGHFVAVKDLALEVRDGEILGIIGHNGAGKTTLLKMITGLVAPTGGTIEIMGMDIARHGKRIKKFTGYLSEESSLYENMTIVEYLMFFSELYGIPEGHICKMQRVQCNDPGASSFVTPSSHIHFLDIDNQASQRLYLTPTRAARRRVRNGC